jgi:hypothetical protein
VQEAVLLVPVPQEIGLLAPPAHLVTIAGLDDPCGTLRVDISLDDLGGVPPPRHLERFRVGRLVIPVRCHHLRHRFAKVNPSPVLVLVRSAPGGTYTAADPSWTSNDLFVSCAIAPLLNPVSAANW